MDGERGLDIIRGGIAVGSVGFVDAGVDLFIRCHPPHRRSLAHRRTDRENTKAWREGQGGHWRLFSQPAHIFIAELGGICNHRVRITKFLDFCVKNFVVQLPVCGYSVDWLTFYSNWNNFLPPSCFQHRGVPQKRKGTVVRVCRYSSNFL